MTAELASVEVWGTVAAAAAAVTAVWAALRKIVPTLRKLGHLADDLMGEPARPGVPARPGLMERVGSLENKVEAVRHEVEYNHGSSLKDKVRKVETDIDGMRKQVHDLARDTPTPIVQQDITINPESPQGDHRV